MSALVKGDIKRRDAFGEPGTGMAKFITSGPETVASLIDDYQSIIEEDEGERPNCYQN